MTRCTSCKDALPGGCSACRPMSYTVGNVTFYPYPPTHTCPQCMRGLPCDPSSLSSLVGAVVSQSHHRTDEEWKRGAFRSQADGSWDACGTPIDSAPTPEVQ